MKRKITANRGNGVFCLLFAALLLSSLALFSGCGNKFFDPTQVGRFRPVPSVNVILDTLGVAEETPVAWEGAEEPLPIDTMVTKPDYAFSPGDIIRVVIFELLQEGVPYASDYIVTESGRISIPEVGIVEASGLTETQLEEEIKRILSPGILKQPTVTVTLVRSQQRAFSIIGEGVPGPGRYGIPRYDFRLTDALAMAGGPRQFNVSYIYVSRPARGEGNTPGTINPGFGELELRVIEPSTVRPQLQARGIHTPRARYQWPQSKVVIASSEMATDTESALFAAGSRQLGRRSRDRMDTAESRRSSSRPSTPEADQPVGVEDILKTLSERSRGQRGTSERTDLEDAPSSYEEPAARGRSLYERENTQDGQRPRSSVGPAELSVSGEPQDRARAGDVEWIFQDGKWVPVPVEAPKPAEEQERPGHIEWVFQDGKWVPVQVGPARPTEPVIKIEPEGPFVVPPMEEAVPVLKRPSEAKTRLIRIPTDRLLAGDPRYNIVIKAGDTIFVPVDIVGEFSIMGNVNRTGYINITGRPMTLKQAIAAAGGLGPLAWPRRCEVIRRIGRKKEEIVMVDLDKIFTGEQPDFFIKPHDLINVGTHATARWRAILRNAFRATYGFGFVYDRNFADRDFYTHRPFPDWF